MKHILSLLILCISFNAYSQHAEVNLFQKTSHIKYVDYQVNNFIKTNKLAGFSFLIANKGRVVYSKAFGISDYTNRKPLTLNTPIPIENCSRLFTATATLKLFQEGKLSLEDTIFGPKSIFETEIPKTHKYVHYMTVRNLLSRNVYIGSANNLTTDKLLNIKTNIKRIQPKAPNGLSTRANLFNYYILGRIIEKSSGKTYEEYIQDMTKELTENELTVPDIPKKKRILYNNKIRLYNIDNITDDSIAGIYCSPGDLMNFVLSLDGQGAVKDILMPMAARAMNSQNKFNPDRSKPWDLKNNNNYIYSSHQYGSALIEMRQDGITWVMCTLGGLDEAFYNKAAELPNKIIKRVKTLP